MMGWRKRIFFKLLLVLIAIQFIRPAHNINPQAMQADIITQFRIPQNVVDVLKRSCYDCHSNNTRYPLYANIQPLGWLLSKHINAGKAELNFNEFATYSARRRMNKLKGIVNSIKDGSMPLSSYLFIHKDAQLSKEDKISIIEWASKAKDSLSVSKTNN